MNWFKHDASATQDAKLKKLIIRHGAVGYAIYFHCLELIAGDVSETNITFELEHDSEIIAENLHIKGTAEKSGIAIVEEIMRTIIDLELFQETGGRVFCYKLLKRLDLSMTSNPQFRALIAQAKAGNHDSIMTHHDSIMRASKQEEQEEQEKHTQEARACPDNFLKNVYEAWMNQEALPRLPAFLGFSLSEQARRAMAAWRGNHSDDIIAAVRNYGTMAASPRDYWPKTRPGMAGFFEGELFLKCLPANFPASCYTDEKKQAMKWEAGIAKAKRDAEEAGAHE